MSAAQMPGYWRFLWMFFMQPISLHYLLLECGIEHPGISGWQWWREREQLNSNHGLYLPRLLFVLVIVSATWMSCAWLAKIIFQLPIKMDTLMVGVAFGVALGVAFGVAFGLALGSALGLALGLTVGLQVGLQVDTFPSVAVGVAVGAKFGIGFGLVLCVAVGVTKGAAFGVAFGVAFGMVVGAASGAAVGVPGGLELGVAFGVAFSVAFTVMYFRIPIYLFESLLQFFIVRSAYPARTLAYAPILFHDLSYFPHPGLARHIVAAAKTAPELAQRVLRVAIRAPGQPRQAQRAQAELAAIEMQYLLTEKDFGQIAALQGFWLPGRTSESQLFSSIANCAQYMQAGIGASSAHTSLQHFNDAAQQLQALENQLLTSKEPLAPFLPKLVKDWRAILAEYVAAAQIQADKLLPNPYIIGVPLTAKQSSGREVFRGRDTLIAEVETLLADQNNTLSLALIGPRRCGKSSLLNMLRVMLPDTIVVLFDLQDNPADSPENFYRAIVRTSQDQAWQSHQVRLPDLPLANASPIEALKIWLDQVDASLSAKQGKAKRMLLCIDEFERLETLFPDKERELLQLMGLLRATIQHKRHVRLLVAGAAPFDELGKIWNDHFINLREIRLGFLDRATVCSLLIAPIAGFPREVISPDIANEIFARSQGQPFLTQWYGYALLNRLNRAERRTATLEDIDEIEPEILQSASYYFRGIWQEIPPATQTALTALAHAEQVELPREMRRWLRRRLLINEDGQLYVPLFGRWLREKDEMA